MPISKGISIFDLPVQIINNNYFNNYNKNDSKGQNLFLIIYLA